MQMVGYILFYCYRFVTNYFAAPGRGYGGNVVEVFATLKATRYKDIWAPAAVLFDGHGSYGNGGLLTLLYS